MRPRPRRQAKDCGNATALEAMVVVLVLVVGAGYLTVVEQAHRPGPAVDHRGPLEDQVGGLLQGMFRQSTNDWHSTTLEKVLTRGMEGNASLFDNLVARALPPGTECRLFLDHDGTRRRVVGSDEDRRGRESVSRVVLWNPQWAYTFALPSLGAVGPLQPLDIEAYGVSQGALLREHGVPLVVEATTDLGNYTTTAMLAPRPGATPRLLLQGASGAWGHTHVDSLTAMADVRVHEAQGTVFVPPSNFTVPSQSTRLLVEANFTGVNVAYTLNLTSPLGVKHTVQAQGSGQVQVTSTINDPTPGSWNLTGTGRIVGDDGTPASAWVNLTASTVLQAEEWVFSLNETANGTLHAGTRLTLDFPAVFSELDQTSLAQAGWRNIAVTTDLLRGHQVRAELDSPLQNASRTFSVHAAKPLVSEPVYVVQGSLDQGGEGQYRFALTKGADVSLPQNPLQRGVVVSGAKVVAPGSYVEWGLLFPAPSLVQGAGGEVVQSIRVRSADGSAVFQGVSGQGWSLVSAKELRWEGAQAVGPNRVGVVQVAFQVQDGPRPWEPGIRVPLTNSGRTFELGEMAQPWVYRGRVPPEEWVAGTTGHGYDLPNGYPPTGNGTFEAAWYARGKLLRGSMNYSVDAHPTLGALQEVLRTGLARSQLTFSEYEVRKGGEVNVTVDFRGLLDGLNASGYAFTGWNVELKVFDPVQPFFPWEAMTPGFYGRWGANVQWETQTPKLDAVLPFTLAKAAEIQGHAAANVTLVAPLGSFTGPHAVVAQANFAITDAVSGQTVWQAARKLGLINVLPQSGAQSSTYWALMECWLPDW